jgi:hypothetical protein
MENMHRILPSATRSAMQLRIRSCDIVSKKAWMSASTTHLNPSMSRAERLNCLMSITVRTEAKRELREVRLEDGFQERTNDLLSDTISDSGDAQRPIFAVPFGDEDPAQRSGVVASSCLRSNTQGGKIVVQVGFKRADVYLVYSGGSAIALDGPKGTAHTSHVDSSGQGMGFTALVGQQTLLAERMCCEVTEG